MDEQHGRKYQPSSRFITAVEIARDCGCSCGQAYRLIRQINGTLKKQGYIIPLHGQTLRSKYVAMTGGE